MKQSELVVRLEGARSSLDNKDDLHVCKVIQSKKTEIDIEREVRGRNTYHRYVVGLRLQNYKRQWYSTYGTNPVT